MALQQNKFTLQEIFYQRGRAQYGPRRLPGHRLLPMTMRRDQKASRVKQPDGSGPIAHVTTRHLASH
jgi:hypothetical protein